ncbi:MAG: LiaI-LiaF-like domain-containing protein [Bacillota bacterium]
MRQWRVGSFSMALVLIILGTALLISQFNNIPAWKLLTNWWPAVLILLGIEILVAAYFSKIENPRIKYDFFAVILVFTVGALSLGIYVLTSSGFLTEINRAISVTNFNMDIPESRQQIPEEVKKVVIQENVDKLNIHTGKQNNEAVLFGQANIGAASLEEAKQVVGDGILTAHRVDEILYLGLNGLPSYNNRIFNVPRVEQSSYTLVFPESRQMEIIGNKGFAPLELSIDNLVSKWFVSNNGPVKVSLSKDADLEVVANSSEGLYGNVSWQLEQNPGEDTAVASSFPNKPGSNKLSGSAIGRVKVGEGKALLTITSGSVIWVDIVE